MAVIVPPQRLAARQGAAVCPLTAVPWPRVAATMPLIAAGPHGFRDVAETKCGPSSRHPQLVNAASGGRGSTACWRHGPPVAGEPSGALGRKRHAVPGRRPRPRILKAVGPLLRPSCRLADGFSSVPLCRAAAWPP
jgi:hypothetical protein